MKFIIFLILNFGALALGGLFTGKGVSSDWYALLNKAPWTPPGWVFGAAWTTIMITFSVYMAYLWGVSSDKKIIVALFLVQWILNVSWNPVFFTFHQTGFALVIIVALTGLLVYFSFTFWAQLGYKTLLIVPYVVWLGIATSLNAYAWVKN